jgi:hypothetical protein
MSNNMAITSLTNNPSINVVKCPLANKHFSFQPASFLANRSRNLQSAVCNLQSAGYPCQETTAELLRILPVYNEGTSGIGADSFYTLRTLPKKSSGAYYSAWSRIPEAMILPWSSQYMAISTFLYFQGLAKLFMVRTLEVVNTER